MAAGKIYIGTSGWSYKHWKGIYYPESLPAKEWLTFHAKTYDTTEINNSFYRLPGVEVVKNWAKEVPKEFKFCPKISRFVTHTKRLKEPELTIPRFFEVFDQIKKHLGPVLIQLHPKQKFDSERLQQFLAYLHEHYRDYIFALEPRHETWLTNECYDLMKKYKTAFVISHSGEGIPYAEVVTAKHIYVRFHGPDHLYASGYPKKMLREYADKFERWKNEGHTVWVFFNNDLQGHAIKDSKTLLKMMKE